MTVLVTIGIIMGIIRYFLSVIMSIAFHQLLKTSQMSDVSLGARGTDFGG
jgi:hypothetical protein